MADDNTSNIEPVVSKTEQQQNNNEKKLTGFQLHPENINRNGPPKRTWTWSGVIEKAVEEKAQDGQPIKIHVARALIAEALKGNPQAIKELMNRMDGMPSQPVDHSGEVNININELLDKVYGESDNEDQSGT